ncbi:MAG: PTS sugar transporter subunit IIA [Alphaproteobacteria bacterium]|nr:PTS sugar transporter subunit IIA [Alphaproteobacteria bacterium]
MIGLALVTHGRLAIELLAALEHVVGPQEQVAAVCIGPDDDMEDRRAEIARVARTLNTGDGVVLLTDMFGGTPSNLAISVLGASDQGDVEVVAGVNLPMLVKFATCRRNKSLVNAVADAEEAGRKYIQIASRLLAETSN